ncbi:patatin-like phospholipase family protein [Aliagarivorans taiwanensis]|uniref:patatin-like phospholipase family protein n=1 Tax=Aliagarivorans taiwanensis TaxID=561966 RepID=UPI0006850133|nr:patatin family protein [Aliagarivorans taiwanensis]
MLVSSTGGCVENAPSNINHALVVEGGAMRGIFASGVLDAFLSQNYQPFDAAFGVSSGAANVLGYLAKAPQRSMQVITQLATSRRFYNPTRFIRGGHLVDVGWLWRESQRQMPVDQQVLFNNIPFYAALTDIDSGKAKYYRVSPDNLDALMEATAALPVVYKHTPCFSEGCFTDGGVTDSLPVKKAYKLGASKITVILSHPDGYSMKPSRFPWLAKGLLRDQPQVKDAYLKRAEGYNASLDFIRNPPEGLEIEVIAPQQPYEVERFTMSKSALLDGYVMGLNKGAEHLSH